MRNKGELFHTPECPCQILVRDKKTLTQFGELMEKRLVK